MYDNSVETAGKMTFVDELLDTAPVCNHPLCNPPGPKKRGQSSRVRKTPKTAREVRSTVKAPSKLAAGTVSTHAYTT
jgi:hypothetical protein